jgi:hypothetical protein
MSPIPLAEAIEQLASHYGEPARPEFSDPWEMIVWENIAYLVDDSRRREAITALRKHIGIRPEQILSATQV